MIMKTVPYIPDQSAEVTGLTAHRPLRQALQHYWLLYVRDSFIENINRCSSMEKIQHKHVAVRGLNIHLAEIGSGPAVLLLHGFPEIWYSWRHQMVALANAGFHAIAPDFRGYGLSDQPSQPEKATFLDLVEDLVALLDVLGIGKVFVVGKDFGAFVVYLVGLLHPGRVIGIVTLGIPYMRPGPQTHQLESFPEGFYVRRWQEPGRAEADFGRFDVKSVIRNIYTLFSGSELPVAEEGKEIMHLFDPSTPLPYWFTEDDLKVYASLYEKSGFGFPLQVPYRCMTRDREQLSHLTDYRIKAPSLLIMGTKDYVLKVPGMEPCIKSEILKADMPNLQIKFFPEGSHFVQEQFPEEVNKLLLDFLTQLL